MDNYANMMQGMILYHPLFPISDHLYATDIYKITINWNHNQGKDDWFEHENETFNWHCLVFICSELRLGEWEDTISLRPQQNLWHTTQTLHTSLRRKTHRQRYRHSRTSRYEMGNAYNWLKPTSKSSLQIVCKLALKLQHWKLTRSRYLTDQHFEFVGDWVSKNSQKLAASATHRAVLRLKNLTALI